MARRQEVKGPARSKSRAQSKEERKQSAAGLKRAAQEGAKQARAKAVSSDAPRAKAGRSRPTRGKPARAKVTKAANGTDDVTIETRLTRLEQAVALQADRSEELLEKIEAVLASSQAVGETDRGPSGEAEQAES